MGNNNGKSEYKVFLFISAALILISIFIPVYRHSYGGADHYISPFTWGHGERIFMYICLFIAGISIVTVCLNKIKPLQILATIANLCLTGFLFYLYLYMGNEYNDIYVCFGAFLPIPVAVCELIALIMLIKNAIVR